MERPENMPSWRKYLNLAVQVLMDFKVFGLVVLNILLIYMGVWDTVMRPNLDQMAGRDKALQEQKKALEEKQGLQKKYTQMEQRLKSLDTKLVIIPEGNSAKVVSVTEAAEILELARGNLRDVRVLPTLLPPHDQRSDVSLTPTTNSTFDLLNPEGAPAGAEPGSAGPDEKSGAQPVLPPGSTGPDGASSVVDADSPEAVSQPVPMGSTTLPVEKYDYDLKVSGTYAALMDVLNELVIRRELIKINKVVISRPTNADPQPDAKENPDFPLKLEMVVSLSMLLRPDHAAAP